MNKLPRLRQNSRSLNGDYPIAYDVRGIMADVKRLRKTNPSDSPWRRRVLPPKSVSKQS